MVAYMRKILASFLFVFVVMPVGFVQAGTPSADLKSGIKALQLVMKNSPNESIMKTAVSEVLWTYVDAEEVGTLVLRDHKAKHIAKFPEFLDLFKQFLVKLAMSHNKKIPELVFVISEAAVSENKAVVPAQIRFPDGDKENVNFYMRRTETGWKVYDLKVSYISIIIGNYRTQFDKVIRDSSFDELLKLLRAKLVN